MRASEMVFFRQLASFFLLPILLAPLVLGAFAKPAAALSIEIINNIEVAAYADSQPRAGEQFEVAFVFKPDEGWHGYWINPGDAGVGLRAYWMLPDGWEAGEPRFPVPEKLLISGLMNHVYNGEHVVIVPISVPADADLSVSPEIGVTLEWLACTDRICVPEGEYVQLDFAEIGAIAAADRFNTWRSHIPPQIDQPALFQASATRLKIAIPLPASLKLSDPHVYLEEGRISSASKVDYAGWQAFRRQGDELVAIIPIKQLSRIQQSQMERVERAERISGILAFGPRGEGIAFTATPGEVAETAPLINSRPPETPFLLLIGGALLGGLLLNLMPCVFPILSLKAMALVRAGEGEKEARRDGVAYTAGVVIACLALGGLMLALRAGGAQIGWAFQLQEPAIVVALLVLAAVLTANFAGIFELPGLPIRSRGKPATAFGTGLLAAFVATPCTGPFMAAAMGASLLLPTAQALALFAALGLGLALPFLLLGFVPALRERLPKPGPWMERFRKAMALPMGLTALALVWLTSRIGGQGFALMALVLIIGLMIGLMVTGRLQRAGKMAWPAFGLIAAPFLIFAGFALPSAFDAGSVTAAQSVHHPRELSPEALQEALASGQPVFVWFTADWCITCKVNEPIAIEREEVREAFEAAGVIPIRGDWSQPDPQISRFLAERGVAGIPLYLWYPAGGAEAEQLPQVLTPNSLIEMASD